MPYRQKTPAPPDRSAVEADTDRFRLIHSRCEHRHVTDEQARVLARQVNVAVTWLHGRAFPGIHVQGDTFAELHRTVADVAKGLRQTVGDSEELSELDHVVQEMANMLSFYESALEARDLRLPYHRHEP
jgi:hypothetical protein